jgi:hypothetical protein
MGEIAAPAVQRSLPYHVAAREKAHVRRETGAIIMARKANIMAKILVAGGVGDDVMNDTRTVFAAALGKEIIYRGHMLLGGCRTGLDAAVAKAAYETAIEKNWIPRKSLNPGFPPVTPLRTTKEKS